MKFELYKDMVLTRDLPEERLKRGDIVKLVEHHVARDGEEGYSAEVFNALGETLTVITVPESALEPLREVNRSSKSWNAPVPAITASAASSTNWCKANYS